MPRIERRPTPQPKVCIACARPFTWRKKWERDWEGVKYCSDACRRRGPARIDASSEEPSGELSRKAPTAASRVATRSGRGKGRKTRA
jgi:hypothetical protein